MKCRRCGSENTNIYEREDEEEEVGHGCLWWLFIGWWWWIICLCLSWIGILIGIVTLFPTNIVKKKHKYCYCRDCGYEERVE